MKNDIVEIVAVFHPLMKSLNKIFITNNVRITLNKWIEELTRYLFVSQGYIHNKVELD